MISVRSVSQNCRIPFRSKSPNTVKKHQIKTRNIGKPNFLGRSNSKKNKDFAADQPGEFIFIVGHNRGHARRIVVQKKRIRNLDFGFSFGLWKNLSTYYIFAFNLRCVPKTVSKWNCDFPEKKRGRAEIGAELGVSGKVGVLGLFKMEYSTNMYGKLHRMFQLFFPCRRKKIQSFDPSFLVEKKTGYLEMFNKHDRWIICGFVLEEGKVKYR